METKQAGEHTQGEWREFHQQFAGVVNYFIKSGDDTIAEVNRHLLNAKENSRLIAAAPSLLQTLTEVKQALLDRGEKKDSLLIVSINNTLNKTK